MTRIFLGLGSNVRPQHFLPLGIRELRALLGSLELSPAYRGQAMGFDGDPCAHAVTRQDCTINTFVLQDL